MNPIIKKRIATGVIAGMVAFGMVMIPAVPAQNTVHAQTDAEVRAQIQNLLQLIAELQARLVGQSQVPSVCPYTWTRDLTIGSTGTDVLRLQQYLNAGVDTRLAVSGAGSPGNETMYYGSITANAVTRFQNKHASEVLSPIGLVSGTGYFGAMTRSKINNLCVTSTPPADDEDPAPDDDELQGGEGDITDFDVLSSFNDEEVSQGETETVFGFEFEADGSDLSVRRVDILFEANDDAAGSNDDADARPWNFIEELTLRMNGDVVKTMKVNSSQDWSKVSSSNMDGEGDDDTYRIRFSGLSERVDEGERAEFTLDIKARSVLDSGDIPQNFEIAVADDGIRAIDGAGLNVYGGSDAASYQVQMTFTNITTGELELSSSEDFDTDYAVKASDTTTTDNIVVGMFELEADNQDVIVENLSADVVVQGGSDVDNIVTRLGLYVGNSLIEAKTVSSSGASTTVTFDDIDYTIDKDERVTFTLKARVQKLDGTTDQTEGVTIYTVVYGSQIDAEDAEGDTVTVSENWNASSDPDTVGLYSKLPELELVSTSASRGAANTSGETTSGTYTIKFNVKAVGGDIYIPANATGTTTTSSAGSSDTGVEYLVEASGGTAQISGMSAVLNATGATKITSTNPDLWRINNGQTATFTLTVNYGNNGNGLDAFYYVKMIGLNWDIDQDTTPDREFISGFDNYQTNSLFLNN
ncbi:MAG: hypothetical protein WDZ70_00945 [Candidatus Paceibacterota bacterium]